MSDDTIMMTEALEKASEQVRLFLKEQGSGSVSELRQLLKTNRRVIIPLLELLDKQGVTMRQKDKRVLSVIRNEAKES